jgi:hypothetical protein
MHRWWYLPTSLGLRYRDHRRCRTGHLILTSSSFGADPLLVGSNRRTRRRGLGDHKPPPRHHASPAGVVGNERHTHRGAGAGRLRLSPTLRPSHYEQSIWLGQERRGEIPLLRGRELPNVVTRWRGSFGHTRSTGFGAADPHCIVGSSREAPEAPISGGNSVPAFSHRAKR